MMAAIGAAEAGASVTLLEKNEKLGKKLYITGKGRCNLTNGCDMEELLDHVVTNRRFLYSAFRQFDNRDTVAFFEALGMPTKTERGNRVFPVSDKASDVIRALEGKCRKSGVTVHLHAEAAEITTVPAEESQDGETESGKPHKKKKMTQSRQVTGVVMANGTVLRADAVILATGGLSYPTTGSTGDGYRMSGKLGHTVTRLLPSLVSLQARDACCATLAGLSLKNIGVTFRNAEGTVIYEDFGELLFTHKGVSGPVVLTATAECADATVGGTLTMDLKPGMTEEQLDNRLVRDLEAGRGKQLKNMIGSLVPVSLGMELLHRCGLTGEETAGTVTREKRQELLRVCKSFSLRITGMGGFSEAVVTKGGVAVDEVNPSTMESRLIRGLFLAGEVLDVDARTGGFNLQIAWSTGMLAGRKAADE